MKSVDFFAGVRIVCHDQDSAEWFTARTGKIVTASRMYGAMRRLEKASGSKKKGDWHSDHDKVVREIALEMMTGVPAKHRLTEEMFYGKQWEGAARKAYAQFTGEEVQTTGLALHPTINWIGASPDLVTLTGGGEIKIPLLKNHMNTIIEDEIPEEYKPQMQTNMMCFRRPHWDYITFSPADPDDDERMALPEGLRLYVKRLDYDPNYRLQKDGPTIEEAATATIEEAVALVQKLSQSRHLRLQKPEVEMPKEMLLSAGEEPIF